ncbi:hypothetical protein CLOM_g13856 [Closterium sp. NIES-68]|nr:hypothetical protein CLOM_g13856 [Closterium sp. NIES-68]GJP71050.1 hypothetical protein CLOP_g1919 [Closterium sp. NIES-67]
MAEASASAEARTAARVADLTGGESVAGLAEAGKTRGIEALKGDAGGESDPIGLCTDRDPIRCDSTAEAAAKRPRLDTERRRLVESKEPIASDRKDETNAPGESVYIAGRYLKFSRALSQSPWTVDDGQMGDGSVQDAIASHLLPLTHPVSHKFQAAGREDIDVRMLGSGRPFLLEFKGAKLVPTVGDVKRIEGEINEQERGKVGVLQLQLADARVCAVMRQGEAEKQKSYVAVVWLSRPITQADVAKLESIRDLELQQKTPIRVLHRRSPLTRPRTIYSMQCHLVPSNPHVFLLHLTTQAGTYVKEFVHGDFGRTQPNVGSLLNCEADILQLDVVDIKMDFLL